EQFFEFASFLASAARGSVEEGGLGASLRFLDALSRLPGLTAKANDDKFLGEMSELIKKRVNVDFLVAREKYIELLDEILVPIWNSFSNLHRFSRPPRGVRSKRGDSELAFVSWTHSVDCLA